MRFGDAVVVALTLMTAGCGTPQPADPSKYGKVAAVVASGACAKHTDSASCGAAEACRWTALRSACPANTTCPAGACLDNDGCSTKTAAASCAATGACAWSRLARLCPLGADCAANGFCHSSTATSGGCACASPLYCPAGSACPAAECDCAGGGSAGSGGSTTGSGGGSCTCACPACAPGEACAPCACDCAPSGGGGSGCVTGGTCACTCPACLPGETCPACECGCAAAGGVASGGVVSGGSGGASSGGSGAPVGGGATTCVCPACFSMDGGGCPPCTCSGAPDAGAAADACSAHPDQATCTANPAEECRWYGLGMPCQLGQPCRSGVCQKAPAGGVGGGGSGGGGCACACPDCAPGQSCPPCRCDCSQPNDAGCTPPPALPPSQP